MPVDPIANAVESFSAPLEDLIVALGKGIAEAQTEMDRNSIRTQEAIDGDPMLSALGLQATWYQFPRVDVMLKLAVTVVEDHTSSAARGLQSPFVSDLPVARRLIAQPVSAAYQNHFNYSAEASSTITLSIVPVPPQLPADQVANVPRLTRDQVQEAALASSAAFSTIVIEGRKVAAPNLRFDVNFNAAGRLWYVLQYDRGNPVANAVVVSVDDVTGMVRVIR